tara:strand:- start:1454 stop:1870 length:417 start_codon:yes stop_codon:yes gene_type:complete
MVVKKKKVANKSSKKGSQKSISKVKKKKPVAKKKVSKMKRVPKAKSKVVKKEKSKKKEKQIGTVSNYFKHVKAAAIKMSSPLKVGDKIRIVGGETDFEMAVKSMQIHREKVEKSKKGDEIGVLVKKDVHKGYKVFLVK